MGLEHSLPGWKTHSSAPYCLPVSLHVLPLTKGDLASFRKKKEDTLDRKKSWEPCPFPCRSSSSSKVAGPSYTRDNVIEEPGHRVFGS